MNRKILIELEEKLKNEKANLEKELKEFAIKDKKNPGDWDTKYPHFDKGETGHTRLETAADEVEEFSTLLPIEFTLEKKLQRVNLALEKIGNGTYGMCSNCKKEIPLERLKISPEALVCLDCEKNK